MIEHKTLRPVGGARVRRPDTGRHLAPEGESVPMTTFWARRVAAGEVEEVPQAKAKAKPAGSKAETGRQQSNRE